MSILKICVHEFKMRAVILVVCFSPFYYLIFGELDLTKAKDLPEQCEEIGGG